MIAWNAECETGVVALPPHGGQLRAISTRYGIPIEQLLDFSANINPGGPPPSVLTALRAALKDSSMLVNYPDLEYFELKQAISRHASVGPVCIAVANGFVPLLEAALRTLRIQRCLLPVPAFSEYRLTMQKLDIPAIPFLLAASDDFRYRMEEVLKTAMEHGCDAILLANPQNPSGALCDAKQMMNLIEQGGRCGIKVLVDEAFIDYAPSESITRKAHQFANTIVFRSVTKFFAIPGLRAAYAVSNPTLSNELNRSLAPWAISTLASIAVCAALEDKSFAQNSRRLNEVMRLRLQQKLQKLGHRVYPSAANFLLLSLSQAIDPRTFWDRMIAEHHVVIRSCTNYENLDSRSFRVAVRSELENDRLIDSLDAISK